MPERSNGTDSRSVGLVPTRVRIPFPTSAFSDFSSINHDYGVKHAHIFRINEDFLEWITYQGFIPNHVSHLRSYFNRHLRGKRFKSPQELERYIQQQTHGVHALTNTARVYLRYCEKLELLPEPIITKYRSVLKISKSRKDFFVPSNEEVIANYRKVASVPKYSLVYLVLATSGIRYIECLTLLKDLQSHKFTINGNYAYSNVSLLRNTKNINNIYIPLFVFRLLQPVNSSYDSLRQKFHKKGCTFSLKYLRKWHYNLMLYNNVPESVADFIQGRASQSISANHYLAKSQQASFWYEKLVPVLENMLHNNNISKEGD